MHTVLLGTTLHFQIFGNRSIGFQGLEKKQKNCHIRLFALIIALLQC